MDPVAIAVGCFIGFAGTSLVFIIFAVLRPWLRLVFRGGLVSLTYFIGMRLRGTPVNLVIDAYTSLLHSGANVTLRDVEAHYVANQTRIMTARELISSIRKDPIETHVPLWIEDDDIEWLTTYCSERAEAISKDSAHRGDNGGGESSGQSISEAQRLERIASAASIAAERIQQRSDHA